MIIFFVSMFINFPFQITRNVSDPEIEGKKSSRDQVSELSEHEKLYNFKKALIDVSTDIP